MNYIIKNILLDFPTITSIICSIFICIASYYYSLYFFVWAVFNSYASFFYHYTQEYSCKKIDLYSSSLSLSFVFYQGYKQDINLHIFDGIFLSLAFFYLGRSWTHCRPRKENYAINHSFFHIFITIPFCRIISSIK